MVYKGHIKNGAVVLDNDTRLPEGTEVEVVPVSKSETSSGSTDFARSLLELAGSAKGLPSDLARNHDHYIYGTPKK